MEESSSNIQEYLEDLDKQCEQHLYLSKECMEAADGNFFTTDILALAALNRSMSNLNGFIALAKDDNFLLVNSIIRLQLDTLLRFYAIYLVKDPHELASRVLMASN